MGDVDVATHMVFVALGVAVAALVVLAETRRLDLDRDAMLVAVTGALVGGGIGMRLSGWLRHLDPGDNPSLALAWQYGAKSILGGLAGAYVGVLVAKRLGGYTVRTGDAFAPAVALGMAVGRIGCHLAEAPGRVTSLPWGVHAPATVPQCPGCVAGAAMHPSFLYEIGFHLVAFVLLMRVRRARHRPGELLTLYLAAYAVFRFAVEFVRANEVVALSLTRPQWFLLLVGPMVIARVLLGWRRGWYIGVPDALVRRARPWRATTVGQTR
ncbi:MAG: prolipoprotein diacylglyceryl transferase [Actinomycetota bacterium]|nr:prolipoprotein diacylglyceryl transferase [Actinomycetota bacterium]